MVSNIILNRFKNLYEPNSKFDKKIKEIKIDGWKNFNNHGLPPSSHTSELWKYTNFSKLYKSEFSKTSKKDYEREFYSSLLGKQTDTNTIFIVDGFYDEKNSIISNEIILENAVNLKNLKYLNNQFGSIAINSENEMIALNSSLMQDPILVSVRNSNKVNDLQIIIVNSGENFHSSSFPRLFVEFSPNTKSNIVEMFVNLADNSNENLTVPVIEYLLGKKSEVSHKRIQIDHGNSYYFQFDRILQNEESRFKSTSFSFSGLLSRYDIHSDLNGINSDCSFHGLYVTDKNQHQENEISTTHSVERCSSDQMFKGILAGKSRAIFSGKVLVKKNAQKTRAFQKDLNFLLSKSAEVDTKPSLEIYADDVVCSHGATAGNIDKNMLFYLESRGINKDQATSMLIRGFAQEIIEEFQDELLIEYLEKLLDEKIPTLDVEGIM